MKREGHYAVIFHSSPKRCVEMQLSVRKENAMASKISWALVAVLAIGLGSSIYFLNQTKTERDDAVRAKKAAEEGATKAVLARQQAESAALQTETTKKLLEAELSSAKTEIVVAKKQVEEVKAQTPKLEA